MEKDIEKASPSEGARRFKLKLPTLKFSAAYAAKIALLTAIAFLLYAFGFFNLPFMFPGFLEMQFSELPALLAGFSMGPFSGCAVVVLKCLFKLPMSRTGYVGELTDILIGIAFVLPASLIYKRRKNIKHALLGLGVGSASVVVLAVLINRFVSIPFYVEFFFEGNFNSVLGICRALYPKATLETFYTYYLGLAVVPFNLLRCLVVSALTFLLYKRLSRILHWEGGRIYKGATGLYVCEDVEETYALAARIAQKLKGGETLLLEGGLGAGKTTFTKGLAAALGIEDEVTSPTFTILNVYESGRLPLYHMDMYRIENEAETEELGFEDTIPDNAVKVIEWNKLCGLTGRVIRVKISVEDENAREFDVRDSLDAQAAGGRKRGVLERARRQR